MVTDVGTPRDDDRGPQPDVVTDPDTDARWLVVTHGLGAMRTYALGCALLDRDDQSKVIGRTKEPILTATHAERSGYVPNVVYTCGVMKVGERLLVPYGISDSAVGFATVKIADLLDLMR